MNNYEIKATEVRLATLNVRSIQGAKKRHEILEALDKKEVQCAILTETWLNYKVANSHEEPYEMFQSPFKDHQGVALVVNRRMPNTYVKPLFPDLHTEYMNMHMI